MNDIFNLNICTIEGKTYKDKVKIVNLKLSDGQIGILKDELPMVGAVEICILEYINEKDENIKIALNKGVMCSTKDEVTILADSFETKQEIDIRRAEQAKMKAENRLKESKTNPNIDVQRATISLKKAINRLTLIDKN